MYRQVLNTLATLGKQLRRLSAIYCDDRLTSSAKFQTLTFIAQLAQVRHVFFEANLMRGVHAGLRQAVSAVKAMLSLSETLLAAGTLAVGRNTFTIQEPLRLKSAIVIDD